MSNRMARYLPLMREFAARDELLHDAVAHKLGLHATDEKVLRLLTGTPMTAGALAGYLGLTGPAVTAAIDRLESRGYVTRERNTDDRRRITIRAVPAKLQKANQAYAGLTDAMTRLLERYDAAQFALIAEYLSQTTQVLAEQTAKLRNGHAKRAR